MRKGKSSKKSQRSNNTRVELTTLAARIMYEEGVDQFYDAKRIAARRMLSKGRGNGCRSKDLPSNGEISAALDAMANLYEGDARVKKLFAMRMVALDVMDALSEFYPRLIGSVSTGRIRAGSDIDLHVFTDELEYLEQRIRDLGWQYETQQVCIQKQGKPVEFTHAYVDMVFPVELSVYPIKDLRVRGRSSTDGKPIIRLSQDRLQELIAEQHADFWQNYLTTGEVAGME